MSKFIAILVATLVVSVAGSTVETQVFDHAVYAKKKRKPKVKEKVEATEEVKADADAKAETDSDEDEPEDAEAADDTAASATLQRGNRMEFDGRLIRGETAGSGAVFLFQRVPRPLPSMVKTRTSYLGETVQEVLGDSGTAQFDKTKVEAMKEIEREGKAKILKLQTESGK